MKSSFFNLCIFLFLFISLEVIYSDISSNHRILSQDREIHSYYIELASMSYNSGNYRDSVLQLQKSAEFTPLSRDYYILLASLCGKFGDFQKEFFYLSRAMDLSNDFEKQFENLDIERRFYELHYIMKRYSILLKAHVEDKKYLTDKEKDFFYAISLSMSCQHEELERIQKDFFHIYSNDVRFYLALLNCKNDSDIYLQRLKGLASSVEISEKQGQQIRKLTAFERSILLALIRRLDNVELQREVLESVFFWFKGDVNYINYAGQLGMSISERNVDELWDYFYLEKDFLTEEQLSQYVSESNTRIGHDSDNDGIPDQIGIFEGLNRSWMYDNNQDGTPEYTVILKDGIIEKITENRGNKNLTWQFSYYPIVKSVDISEKIDNGDSEIKLVYHVLQGVMLLDFKDSKVIFDGWNSIPVLISKGQLPELWKVLENTYQIDEYHSGHYFRKMMVDQGKTYKVFEDSSGKGYFDRFLVIENWKVVYGLRNLVRKDRFDVYEHYESGIFKGLAYFGDDEYYPSYYENQEENKYVKIWTFDKERYVDVIRTKSVDKLLTYIEMTYAIEKLTPQDVLGWNDVPKFVLNQL